MSRLHHLSRPGWMSLGLIVGLIAVPAIALGATGQLVTITGGHTASVSAGGQLRAVEMDPANIVHGAGATSGGCVPLTVAPAGKALIIKQINIDAVPTGASPYAAVYADAGCSGGVVAVAEIAQRGVTSLPLGPGIPVRAGNGLYLNSNAAAVRADALGYSVTAAAVPARVTGQQQIDSAGAGRAIAKAR